MKRRGRAPLLATPLVGLLVGMTIPAPVGEALGVTSSCQPRTSAGALPAVTAADAGRLVMAALPGPSLDPATKQLLGQRHLGGVLLFGRSVKSATQLTTLDRAIHAAAGGRRTVISTDQEGGTVRRLPFAEPQSSEQAQARIGPAGVQSLWTKAGQQLRAVGVDLDLAPVADLGLPHGFEGTRAFAADPAAVAPLVKASIAGLRAGKTGATAKHFPGLGGTRSSTDEAVVHAPAPTAASLRPFRAAVSAGAPVVMIDLAIHAGLGTRPAALAPKTYALLRGPLAFHGVAMTDALDAVAARSIGTEAQTAVAAVCAGADMVIAPGSPATAAAVIDALAAAVKSGRLPHARFAEAVARVDRLAAHPAQAPTPNG